jgi:predicted O-methyltransferase YrrM
MKIKNRITQIIPSPLKRRLKILKESLELRRIPQIVCEAQILRSATGIVTDELFVSREIETAWGQAKKRLDVFFIPDMTGGVNPGDRRAIYYLIHHFKPTTVLEIGTHIGASTMHIAAALSEQIDRSEQNASLVTVDIVDVNAAQRQIQPQSSPLDMLQQLGFEIFVEFVIDSSLHYLETAKQKFDFIFLDGDHSAHAVYREIPAALKLLRPNGVILLHDYFPWLKPLWSNGSMIPGPFLTVQRLKREGAPLIDLPFGELPWPTKLNSNVTSLALLLNEEHHA